jgi:hypothetical protein
MKTSDPNIRAKIDRERGVYPRVEERGYCASSPFHPHPKYSLCKGWNPVKTVGTCGMFGVGVHERCTRADWTPVLATSYHTEYFTHGRSTTFQPNPEPDMQKSLRDFRKSMGNPIHDHDAAPAYHAGRTWGAPDYVFGFDQSAAEDAVLRWGWESVIPNSARVHPMEPETPMTATKAMWARIRTEKENYEKARAEREQEQRIRRNERLRIADILDQYAPLADPRKIADYVRSL